MQRLGDGAEPGAAEPVGAAVVGEREQRRLLVHAQLLPARDALGQQLAVPLQPAGEQGIGKLLADPVALLHGRTVAIGGAAPADRPGLVAALGIGVGGEQAALELLDQGQGYRDGRWEIQCWTGRGGP